jgi:hypothetical protein
MHRRHIRFGCPRLGCWCWPVSSQTRLWSRLGCSRRRQRGQPTLLARRRLITTMSTFKYKIMSFRESTIIARCVCPWSFSQKKTNLASFRLSLNTRAPPPAPDEMSSAYWTCFFLILNLIAEMPNKKKLRDEEIPNEPLFSPLAPASCLEGTGSLFSRP